MTEFHRTDGSDGRAAGAPPTDAVEAAVVDLAAEDLSPVARRRALWRVLSGQLRSAGARGVLGPRAAVRWTVDTVIDIAPRLPVRDLATLRAHHGGAEGDVLARRLIRNAAMTTAGIGAAGGGVAAVEWVVTPTLLSAPVLLAAETAAVVAVELKLIAELYEVYGRPVEGTGAQRAVTLLQAWAGRRGIDPMAPGRGVAAALGVAARKELRERLLRRLGRNLSTLGPLLTGAAVAGYLNRRATTVLGNEIRRDIAGDQRAITGRIA
jgi:hypothetical protein